MIPSDIFTGEEECSSVSNPKFAHATPAPPSIAPAINLTFDRRLE